MKIALTILHADPRKGGAERYTVDIATALARRGLDVSVLATTFHGLPPDVTPVPLRRKGLSRLTQYTHFLNALDAELDERQYDVVHAMLPVRRCDVYHPHAGIAAEAVASGHLKHRTGLARGAAAVANRLNRKRRRFAQVEHELLTADSPPLVLCLSNYVKDAARRHYPLDDSHLFRLFNSTDLARFDPAVNAGARQQLRRQFNVADDQVLALMIAQDFERKGLAEAVEAVALLNDPRLVLLVVGREEPRPYRRLAAKLGIRQRVVFAGSTTDPAAFYQAADVFVLPTRHDPCSLVVLEALAMGLPVISTTQNGACEIMTDRKEGFILRDPTDVESLATALRQMLDPDRRSAMSAAARSLRSALSQDVHVERLLTAYERARAIKPFPANG